MIFLRHIKQILIMIKTSRRCNDFNLIFYYIYTKLTNKNDDYITRNQIYDETSSCIKCISEEDKIYLYDAGYYIFYFKLINEKYGYPINLPHNLYVLRRDEINKNISILFHSTKNEILSQKPFVIPLNQQILIQSNNIENRNFNYRMMLFLRLSIPYFLNNLF